MTPAFMTNEAAKQQQGLLSQGQNPQEEQSEPQQNPQEEQVEQQGEQASPEEQAQYEKMIANAMDFIHDQANSDKILEKLSQDDPAEAIGEVTAQLVIKLYESAEQSGKPLMDAVTLEAGQDILNEVINLGVVAGVFNFKDEAEGEQVQQDALLVAMDKFGSYMQAQGKFDKQDLQQLADAAQSGQYDAMTQPPQGV